MILVFLVLYVGAQDVRIDSSYQTFNVLCILFYVCAVKIPNVGTLGLVI